MKSVATIVLLALTPALSAVAGCGEGEGTCYHYKAGQLINKGDCNVTTCANMTSFYTQWDWLTKGFVLVQDDQITIDGRVGYGLPPIIENEKLICYGIKGTDEMVCNDSGVY
jgi:hypothetical protein